MCIGYRFALLLFLVDNFFSRLMNVLKMMLRTRYAALNQFGALFFFLSHLSYRVRAAAIHSRRSDSLHAFFFVLFVSSVVAEVYNIRKITQT